MDLDEINTATSTLTAEDLETLISLLAERRANMDPPVPFAPPKPGEASGHVSVQGDPYLQSQRLKNGGMRLWMRSAGMGWLLFDMTAHQTVTLRDWINASGIHEEGGSNFFSEDIGQGGPLN